MYVISVHMLYSENFYCNKHRHLRSASRSNARGSLRPCTFDVTEDRF